MKKILVLVMILSSIMLVSCGAKKDNASFSKSKPTNKVEKSTQSKSADAVAKSSQSKSSEAAKPSESVASSSETVKTSDVQGSDLTQARLALYHAGIDSSGISDEQLLKYWEASKNEKSDFVQYVKDRL